MRRSIFSLGLFCIFAAASWAQVTLFEEHFTGGTASLLWRPGWADTSGVGNNMAVFNDPTTPEGDGWAGKVGNDLSGGYVGLAYAGDSLLTDYTLSSWVYTVVTPGGSGPYNSLVFRFKPNTNPDTLLVRYYQFDADFDADQRLRFRKRGYDVTRVLRNWTASEIPGGVPAVSGWHQMKVRMQDNQFWFWWDGSPLPGCPVSDTTANPFGSGYFGAYIFKMFDTNAFTEVDDVLVSGDPISIVLTPINAPLVIPAQGGSFSFTATLDNLANSQQTFDAWIKCRYPDGSWYGPMLGPLSLTLSSHASVSRVRVQNIAGSSPPGSYYYCGYVGTYPGIVQDSSGFPFTKSAAAGWGSGAEDWSCTGEPFPGERSQTAFVPSWLDLGASPNPFNPVTALSYQLQATGQVSLRVYDTTGRIVATLVEEVQEAGVHQVSFDGSNLASGIYLVSLMAGDQAWVQKVVLMK